jgi:MraZ protein
MFRGAAKITLDDKGRMVVPARFREPLIERSSGRLVVTVHMGGQRLVIYPMDDWLEVERKIMGLSSVNPETERFQQLMVGLANEQVLDGHGRMLLPPDLRRLANIERHAVLVGQGSRFELWEEKRWTDKVDFMLKSGTSKSDLPPDVGSFSI